MRHLPLLLISLLALAGCGGPADPKPVATAAPSREDMMRKPMTADEKIAAIERSLAPEDKKRAAIARLRAGKR